MMRGRKNMAVKKKDYFLILGISRSESAEGVRAAFRELAKKYHPDKSGSEGTRLFQDIAEAYSILSDPDLRKEYTRKLQKSEDRSRKRHAEKGAKKYSSAHGHTDSDTISALGNLRSGTAPRYFIRESGPMPTEFFRDFSGKLPHSTRPEDSEISNTVDLELILSWGEAREGGILPAELPVISPCFTCRGSGGIGFLVCPACRGRGISERLMGIRLKIPAGVRNGEVLEYRVNDRDRHITFRMHVMIR
jgi:molecular chaperone DnaJ